MRALGRRAGAPRLLDAGGKPVGAALGAISPGQMEALIDISGVLGVGLAACESKACGCPWRGRATPSMAISRKLDFSSHPP